jgi:predicted aminopeptidase
VVNASPKWELKNYNWDYFWVGQMPYKGFFNKEDAQAEAENLRQKDLDVFLRGVSAYSTLGWFNDPILSSMLRYEDWDLVDTIIHETVHANLYIKNNAEFNEQLATFIGLKGMELFYQNKEGANSETLIKARQEAQDQKIFREFLFNEVQKLKEYYTSINKSEIKESERQEQFNKIKNKYSTEIKPQIKFSNFDTVFTNQFNNAFLMLYMTYTQGFEDFDKLWTKVDGQFENFYNEIKKLEKSKDPSQDLKKLL